MKTTLIFETTHAGATTLASVLLFENGQVRAAGGWTAPKRMGITRVTIAGVAVNFALITRNGHARSPITLNGNQAAATIIGGRPGYDFMYNCGKGVIVDNNETLTVTTTATGAGVVKVSIELDDAVPLMDFRAVRVAGSAALVVDTPTPTGANVAPGIQPNGRYKLRLCNIFAAATSNDSYIGFKDGGQIQIGTPHAAALNSAPRWLADDQVKYLSGTGTEFLNNLTISIVDTVATAAATIVLNVGWEVEGLAQTPGIGG